MRRTSFRDATCSVARTLDLVGEWWSLLILRDAFLGITRFEDFLERLGISRNILNQRLRSLVAADILERDLYCEHPRRYDYRLTAKGRDLWPAVTALRQWGDRWAASDDGPSVEAIHESCGQVAEFIPTCSACGETATAEDVRYLQRSRSRSLHREATT